MNITPSCRGGKGVLYKAIILFSGLYLAGTAAGIMYAQTNGVSVALSGDEIKNALILGEGIGDFVTVLTTYSMYPLGFLLLVYLSAFTKAVYPVCGFIVSYRAFYTGYAMNVLLNSPSVSAVYITDAAADIAGGFIIVYLSILSSSVNALMFGGGSLQMHGNRTALTLTLRFLSLSGAVVVLTLVRMIIRMF